MEIKNATDLLSKALAQTNPELGEVESIHQAEIDATHIQTLLADPKIALKALGIKVSDESQVQTTLKLRSQREAQAVALRRRIIVIIIHFRNCDADVIIIA
ncbi:MAG: hypothetical protein AB7F94_09005 [Nitrospira sp.]